MNKAHFNCFIMPLLCWILEGDNASLIKRETFAVDKKSTISQSLTKPENKHNCLSTFSKVPSFFGILTVINFL